MLSKATKNKTILCILLCLLLPCQNGCSKQSDVTTQTVYALDTIITLTIYEPDKAPLLAQAAQKITDYENKFSRTIPDSEISAINQAQGNWVSISEDTYTLLQKAYHYCTRTHGAMDITISPVKELWDFTGETTVLPEEAALKEAIQHVNYETIQFSQNQIRLTDPSAALDLGCIAKGYIADEIRLFLVENGVSAGILNFGGNVVCFGTKPDGAPYKVGIQKPFDQTGALLTTIEAGKNSYSSVVTSGIYERYFELDGKIYHHILDPQTGYPVDNDLYSVTILSDSSTEADALSTACLALGLEEGMELIQNTSNVDAIFVTADGSLYTTY